jgi:adenine-specific DNA-methyltransferase
MNNEATETIKDLMPFTPDLNAERLAKLKELFPDLFTDEGNLNETELKKLVDPKSVNETERYEFRWFGKSNAKRKAFTPTTATLNYDAARSVNPETSENLIIEGENLKVLKLLLCSYREQIKCIYIDPPYNTGKDFVYSDNYSEDRLPYWKQTNVVDEYGVKIDTNADTDGRYHSNWMNMMFSRLLVARQLLRKDGVIFISIDDHEVHNLRRICNEVFGEDNFIGQFAAQLNPRGRHLDKFMAQTHEYIVVYCKNSDSAKLKGIQKDEKMIGEYNKSDEVGKYRELELRNRNPAFNKTTRPNLYYPIFVDAKTGNISLEKSEVFSTEVYPHNSEGGDSCWTWGKDKLEEDKEIVLSRKTNEGSWRVFRKDYLLDENGEIATTLPKSLWLNKEFNNDYGKKAIKQFFGNAKIFDFPKSTNLIKRVVEIGSDENDLVLDFFGGSGVTGQAVMELNEADSGNRKFILVQLPERTDEKSEAYKAGYKLISDITIERNKRVVNRIIEEKRAAHPNLFENNDGKDALKNLGFKVFKLEKSYFPRTEWTPNPDASEAENVQSLKDYIAAKESQLRIDFDRDKLLTEILLKEGFKLNYIVKPYEAVTTNEILHVSDTDKEALICLDNTIETETTDYFKTHKDLKFICLERGLDTTKKWNLANSLGEKFRAI